ncbi:MAG: hypothetical protein KF904_21160 [Rhodoblastus sp.]|nr:hypothetical protein [Rhodoblastus sp.]
MSKTNPTRMRYTGADPRYVGQTANVKSPHFASVRVLAQFATTGFAWVSLSRRNFAPIKSS